MGRRSWIHLIKSKEEAFRIREFIEKSKYYIFIVCGALIEDSLKDVWGNKYGIDGMITPALLTQSDGSSVIEEMIKQEIIYGSRTVVLDNLISEEIEVTEHGWKIRKARYMSSQEFFDYIDKEMVPKISKLRKREDLTSLDIKKQIIYSLKHGDHHRLHHLILYKLLRFLDLEDFEELWNKYNLKLVRLFAKDIRILRGEFFQDITFPDKFSEFLQQKIIEIIIKGENEQIEDLIWLKLYQFLDVKDLKTLPEDKLLNFIELFYTTINKVRYVDYVIEEIEIFTKKVGNSLSPYFRKLIKHIIKSKDTNSILNLILNRWTYMLNKQSLMDLLRDSELDFFNILIKTTQDLGDYYGFNKEIDDTIFEYILEIVTPSEAEALKDLKSLIKEGFIIMYKRDIDKEINSIVKKDNHIVSITIQDSQLEKVPESIGMLEYLKEFVIEKAKITHLPESIGNLRSLKTLEIHSCGLKTIPNSIGNLKSLEELYLNGNNLAILPDSIGNLQSLKILDLYGNNLKTLPLSIGNITSINKINIGENPNLILPKSLNQFNIKK